MDTRARAERLVAAVRDGDLNVPTMSTWWEPRLSDAQAVDLVEAALAEREAYIAELLEWIRRAVEAAAPFQVGGALEGKLQMGDHTVVDGMTWLLAERTRLTAELKEAHGQLMDA